MPKKPTKPASEIDQQFIEAARELGCDESTEAFEGKLNKLAKAKPTTNPEVAAKVKSRKRK